MIKIRKRFPVIACLLRMTFPKFMPLTGKSRYSTRILCYGDSNTWGYEPLTGKRFKRENRWTGVLAGELGEKYTIIEQGLNGRTTVWDDPGGLMRNGGKYLPRCLESFQPLDLVIIFLGTNDLKHRFALSAVDIARGAGHLVDIVLHSKTGRNGNPPYVLLLAPPPVGRLTKFAGMFTNAQIKSKQLGKYLKSVADEKGCFFMDTAAVIKSSDLDGIHLEKKQHTGLGKSIAEFIRSKNISVLPDI